MAIHIRPAAPEDAPGIAEIIRGIERADGRMRETTDAHVAGMLGACLSSTSHSVLVAQADNGTLTGYIAVHWLPYLLFDGPEGFVSELFVRPQQRGLGIGSTLLDAVVAAARARNCVRLQLINMRDLESYHRSFYVDRGWQERPDAASFVLRL